MFVQSVRERSWGIMMFIPMIINTRVTCWQIFNKIQNLGNSLFVIWFLLFYFIIFPHVFSTVNCICSLPGKNLILLFVIHWRKSPNYPKCSLKWASFSCRIPVPLAFLLHLVSELISEKLSCNTNSLYILSQNIYISKQYDLKISLKLIKFTKYPLKTNEVN